MLFFLFEVLMIVYYKRNEEVKFGFKNLFKIIYYYFIFSEICEIEYFRNIIKMVCNFCN